jgi:hypothetical protein
MEEDGDGRQSMIDEATAVQLREEVWDDEPA